MKPQLTTSPGRIDLHLGGQRVASYCTGGAQPGFTSIFAPGIRLVTQLDPATGRCAWIGHGSVEGVPFGTGSDPGGSIEIGELVARRSSLSVGFRHDCSWIAPDGRKLIHDERTVRVSPGPAEGALIDLTICLRCEEEVLLGRAEQGLLSVRFASAFGSEAGGQLRNSNEQFDPAEIHGRQASWCAGIGVVAGEIVGFAVLDHPLNPWHPPPWVCREDGTVSPSPFPWRTVRINAGEPLRLRYRLVTHSGYVEGGWMQARLLEWMREQPVRVS